MTVIASADLAYQLPHILQALARGEDFVVTDGGRPAGRIIPPEHVVPQTPVILEQQRQIFDELIKRAEARADRYPPGFVVDDSYEAIYGERENAQR